MTQSDWKEYYHFLLGESERETQAREKEDRVAFIAMRNYNIANIYQDMNDVKRRLKR